MSNTRTRQLQTRSLRYGATTFILVAGEFDLAAEATFATAFDDVCSTDPGCVVLDLSELSFLDTSGLHALNDAFDRAAEQGFDLAIVPSRSPQVRRVLRITAFDQRLPLAEEIAGT